MVEKVERICIDMVKFIQAEREKEGRKPIFTWKGMVPKVREVCMLQDYEIQLHEKRKSIRQRDLDVNYYIEEF